MVVAQTFARGDALTALATAVVIALLYLLVLRLLDLNEKEPFWTLAVFLGFGLVAGMFLNLLVGSAFLEGNLWGGALAVEATKAVAIVGGVGVLGAVARVRGWSEMSGLMDGLLYGAAAGFGYAVGEVFIRELLFSVPTFVGGTFSHLWPIAVLGLAEGMFAAVTGAGFGAAAERRRPGGWLLLPPLGFFGAVLVHAGYTWLRTGNAFGGGGRALTLITLLLPVAFVAALMAYALSAEQRAIVAGLQDEAERGVVSKEEFRVLRSFGHRRRLYLQWLLAGDPDGWVALRELHNRQVQLALAERRLRRASDPDRRERLEMEAASLRESVLELKRAGVAPYRATSGKAAR